MKEYVIPQPKDNPTASLVIFYKVTKGFEYDDRGWDRRNFARCSRAAKEIIDACKGFELAKKCIESMAEKFDGIGCDWTMETVVKHVDEWILNNGGKKDVNKSVAKFLRIVNDQRANRATSLEGATTGPSLLAPLRDIGIIQPESGSEERRGMEVRRTDGERTRQIGMEIQELREDRTVTTKG